MYFIILILFFNPFVDNGEFGPFTSVFPDSVHLGGQPKCTEVLHCPIQGNLIYLFLGFLGN